MNYQNSLDYLNSFLNFEKMPDWPRRRLWNLRRMQIALDWLARPEKDLFPVLIAGTKGKGSTGFFLESILRAAKIPVGFYSSPHLEETRERIRINGRRVPRSLWTAGLQRIHRELCRRRFPAEVGQITYFEVMTLLSIVIFQKAEVRIAIFEVGMGGRLDATNSMDAKLAVITPIHYDHESVLGRTLRKIAREKAGIIRPRIPVIVAPQKREALREILAAVRRRRACLYPAKPVRVKVGLRGDFQKINAGTALEAVKVLEKEYAFVLGRGAICRGLQASDWPGRIEFLRRGGRTFLLDAAHNLASVEALGAFLKKEKRFAKSVLIFGVSRDKNFRAMLKSLSRIVREAVVVPLATPRSQNLGDLVCEAAHSFDRVYPAGDGAEALAIAKARASRKTLILVTGSFYLVGEVRKILRHKRRV